MLDARRRPGEWARGRKQGEGSGSGSGGEPVNLRFASSSVSMAPHLLQE